ncbi:hypothetical protein B0H19DRAFT_1065402 [Mycena capillaripes]|nr:hypothetical protein B0H19DRAFT_1065402 [Mycena capillaripes]
MISGGKMQPLSPSAIAFFSTLGDRSRRSFERSYSARSVSIPFATFPRAAGQNSMVCQLWNSVVRADPEIAELLHKKACRSVADPFEICGETESSEAVVVHPALQFMSYCMGEKIETAVIFRSATETVAHSDSLQKFPIIDLGIAHDFATRPTVTQMFIKPQKEFNGMGLGGPFCVRLIAFRATFSPTSAIVSEARVTNTRGITVLDVLQAIVTECFMIDSPVLTLPRTSDGLITDDMVDQALHAAFTPEGVRRGKWLNKALCLEGFRRYEGVKAVRKGLRVNAVVFLGLQPSEDEFFRPKPDSEPTTITQGTPLAPLPLIPGTIRELHFRSDPSSSSGERGRIKREGKESG